MGRRLIHSLLVAACLSGGGATAASPDLIRWRVVSVHDGDTLMCVDDEKTQHKVRLFGIDAPEIGQPFGTKSRDALAKLAKGRTVEVDVEGEDRYGRTLATLSAAGEDLNRQMVKAGMAWHYKRYSGDTALAAAERDARAAKRGLWADKKPVPPWEWRATERERKPAKSQPARR